VTAEARAWRTAVVLPWMLFGAALVASIRITLDGDLRVVPPPLSALVLALVIVAVLVRSGQLSPAALVGARRPTLDRLAGGVVLLALGWASACVMALVIPEAGLPKLAGLILVGSLLANTFAASGNRVAALRALFVTCLAGFIVKFIVLDALFDPSRGLSGRLVTSILEGVTLGGFSHVPWAPATGYLAFGTLILYFFALLLLPGSIDATPDRVGTGTTGTTGTMGTKNLHLFQLLLDGCSAGRAGVSRHSRVARDEQRDTADFRRPASARTSIPRAAVQPSGTRRSRSLASTTSGLSSTGRS
jgi:hypothetical protein